MIIRSLLLENELKIIEGCKRNEQKWQEALYRKYYSYGMSIALRYARLRDEAAEILNDCFMKVFDNIGQFNTAQPFKAWFRRILVNTSIDHYRKNLRLQHAAQIDEARHLESLNDTVELLSAEEILQLLDTLPEIYRITFNLYEIEGYSHKEIGELLGVNESTSRSTLTRAKKMLRLAYDNLIHVAYEKVV